MSFALPMTTANGTFVISGAALHAFLAYKSILAFTFRLVACLCQEAHPALAADLTRR